MRRKQPNDLICTFERSMAGVWIDFWRHAPLEHLPQEKDSEIYGRGASYYYKYRQHDARLGRFWSVDPLARKYPYYSPYSFSGNRLVDAVEWEGLEPDRPPMYVGEVYTHVNLDIVSGKLEITTWEGLSPGEMMESDALGTRKGWSRVLPDVIIKPDERPWWQVDCGEGSLDLRYITGVGAPVWGIPLGILAGGAEFFVLLSSGVGGGLEIASQMWDNRRISLMRVDWGRVGVSAGLGGLFDGLGIASKVGAGLKRVGVPEWAGLASGDLVEGGVASVVRQELTEGRTSGSVVLKDMTAEVLAGALTRKGLKTVGKNWSPKEREIAERIGKPAFSTTISKALDAVEKDLGDER